MQVSSEAKILIIGQAPGFRAQRTNIPWNDRLRKWLEISKEEFYDNKKIAIIPIGFCFPGYNKYGGDNPPDLEHAKLWHEPLLNLLPNIKLTLLIGSYAQKYYLKERVKKTLIETIDNWREYLPEHFVLPHPSWHNNNLIRKLVTFEKELLPELREQIRNILVN